MHTLKVATIKIIFAILVILMGAAFFMVPSEKEAQAQGNQLMTFCFNQTTGYGILPGPNESCPDSGRATIKKGSPGFCLRGSSPSYVALSPSLDQNGKPRQNNRGECLPDPELPNGQVNPNAQVSYGIYKQFPAQPYVDPNATPTPTGANPTPSGGATPSPTRGGSTTPTPTRTPVVQGDCETGFHKVGPLCVPTSPFNNNESITSEQTVGGLAARIIRLLLYFAGIVAVFMAIYGGYQVMTAGGDTGQAANGRKTLTNALIGLAIIMLAYIIIQAVINFVT